ncbi:short-chain dehydrogenase/reductase SDR [Novosphingobium nitrogenifigens DSM 19370]|uniref:Short-chain dehydrogenase/reductase SDR n=1 Tax=Novosphingobium nitrogenifigens DSM 19370 TaxID=983920 RepID=F1ZA54_9SPHN|nr:SDR family NAD(P)-dependent oxidoreductase [Novosphingobium nitrogenifigens]EGD58538.1 short-chain dehydrogenase/reductase SDR [Novosphingobium nitrogenifigens DSM 19370]
MLIAGKTALVTGGTDGIGRRIAQELRRRGAHVIVTGRNPDRLDRARSEGFEAIAADLSDRDGVEGLLRALTGRPIDVLVNNAGMGAAHDFRQGIPDPADDERTIRLNLDAPIRLIVGLMEALRSRPQAMIVNVTSGLALAPSAGAPVYCATKAALRSYTQSLRAQLKGTTIHVLEALPPVVDTAMTAGRRGRKLSVERCAVAIVDAMAANADEANVGLVKVLKAVCLVAPWLARRIMIGF